MKVARASSPGKLILSGEHSVVYGYPALVTSIDKGVMVTVEEGNGEVDLGGVDDPIDLVGKAIRTAGGNRDKLKVKVKAELPVSSGLGSSAAVSAAVIKAVSRYGGRKLSDDEWYDLTFKNEKLVRESESGLDPAAVVYGGLIKYIKGKGIVRLAIENKLEFILFNSGKPKELTKDMVVMVADNVKKNPSKFETILKKMWATTEQMQMALVNGENLAKIINKNGKLLEELGVVSEETKKVSNKLRKMGCGVKVTGAGGLTGGSGMMMVYDSDLKIAQRTLAEMGYEQMKVAIGGK